MPLQEAITQMENKLSTTTEGEEFKSVAQVVSEVLAENTKNNKFLKNMGFENAQPRSNEQKNMAELEAEKRANVELRGQLEEMKRAQAEMQAKLDRLLSQGR